MSSSRLFGTLVYRNANGVSAREAPTLPQPRYACERRESMPNSTALMGSGNGPRVAVNLERLRGDGVGVKGLGMSFRRPWTDHR